MMFLYRHLVALSLFSMFAAVLVVDSGYSYGPVLLFLLGVVGWLGTLRTPPVWPDELKILWALVALVMASAAISSAMNTFEWADLDNPSRILLGVVAAVAILIARPPSYALVWGLMIGAAASGYLAYEEFQATGGRRVELTNNPIQTGGLAAGLAGGLLAYALITGQARSRIVAVLSPLALGAAVVCLALTGSRGSLVGLVVGSAVACIAVLVTFRLSWLAWLYLVLSLILPLALAGVVLEDRFERVVMEIIRFYNDPVAPSSIGFRLRMWQLSAASFADAPWFGVGEVQFKAVKAEWIEDGLIAKSAAEFSHAHSDFFDVLIKRGVLGIGAYLGYLLGMSYLFWRQLRRRELPALAGLIVLWVGFGAGLTQGFISHNSGALMFYFWPMAFWAFAKTRIPEATDAHST